MFYEEASKLDVVYDQIQLLISITNKHSKYLVLLVFVKLRLRVIRNLINIACICNHYCSFY